MLSISGAALTLSLSVVAIGVGLGQGRALSSAYSIDWVASPDGEVYGLVRDGHDPVPELVPMYGARPVGDDHAPGVRPPRFAFRQQVRVVAADSDLHLTLHLHVLATGERIRVRYPTWLQPGAFQTQPEKGDDDESDGRVPDIFNNDAQERDSDRRLSTASGKARETDLACQATARSASQEALLLMPIREAFRGEEDGGYSVVVRTPPPFDDSDVGEGDVESNQEQVRELREALVVERRSDSGFVAVICREKAPWNRVRRRRHR